MSSSRDLKRGFARRWRKVRTPLLIALGVFVVHTLSPSNNVGDPRLSAAVSWQFLTHGNFYLEHNATVGALTNRYDVVSRHGHTLPFFPWTAMLLATPADIAVRLLLGRSPSSLSIVGPGRTFLVEVPTASALVALTTVTVRAIALRLGASRRAATVTCLLLAFTTSAWSIASRALWQQTASIFFLTLMLLAAARVAQDKASPTLLGLAGGLAAVCRPTDVVIVGVAFMWAFYECRWGAWKLIAGAGGVGLVFAVLSWLNYGSALPPYYGFGRYGDYKQVPFLQGLAYNLVSPSRGLLIYDPILLLSVVGVILLAKRGRLGGPEWIAILAVPIQLILIAAYGSDGGTVYGPRLMVDVLPFLAVLATSVVSLAVDRLDRRTLFARSAPSAALVLVLLVAGFGLFVNATGAIMRSSRCWNFEPVSIDASPSRAWEWSDPQFVWPYRQIADGGNFHDVMSPVCSIGPH